jgi:hypothetical protein
MLTETNINIKPLPKTTDPGSLTNSDKKINFYDYLKVDPTINISCT